MAAYRRPKFTADWNLTWTHTFKSNLIDLALYEKLNSYCPYDIDDNNNTPAIMSNLVLGWQATSQLKLHTHVLFEGRQTSYNIDLEHYDRSRTYYLLYDLYRIVPDMEEMATAYWDDAVASAEKVVSCKEMPARCILNIGGEYTFGPVTLGLNIHNLLGTRYHRSGMNTNVIPQQGRWFLATLGVQF